MMKRLLDKRKIQINFSRSPLSFENNGGGSWIAWDRFIALNGQNIYHIGNVCGTCSFFFEKLSESKMEINPKEIIDNLNLGLTFIEKTKLDILREIIPNGNYQIALITIKPKFSRLGQTEDYFANEQVELWSEEGIEVISHSPNVNYYRGSDIEIGSERKLFEFFIPLTSNSYLDKERVEYYKKQIQNGDKPTAISLTILDIKEPAVWPKDDFKPKNTSHWCLAHYLIDGHHKIKAASDLNSEITLLSFIASDQGVSNFHDVDELLNYIN
jgi:hypothetical protein